MHPRARTGALLLFALCVFVGAAVLAAEPPTGAPDLARLGRTLASVAGDPPGSSRVGVVVFDVATGRTLFEKNPDEPLNPASNAKIITAACALARLGPEFRFVTSLHGQVEGAAVRGALVLKGHADPTLSSADLWEMVEELRRLGVRRVEGGIIVDDTYFDGDNLPFAFDQQKSEDNAFRAPVGAVSLDHNAISITVRPGAAPLEKAVVSDSPSGYAVVVNDTVTMSGGPLNPFLSATAFENRTRLRVWGQVPLGSRAVTYTRRIDNPSLFAGHGLRAALESRGITVGGEVAVGVLPQGLPLLAEHQSPPLSAVLWETGKLSNNFVTEMVLKTIGAEAGKGPATWAGAVTAAGETLAAWGLPPGSYTYRNGSGLFDANRFSARQFVRVLAAVFNDARIRPEFLAQLATGGVDGTIAQRYREPYAKRYVRAKTGTLDSVSTLSGYVLDASGTRPIAFSILVNDASGYVSAARAYQERIVLAIARELHPEIKP